MLPVDQFAGQVPSEYQVELLLGQNQLGTAYLAQQPARGRRVLITTFHLPSGISAQEYEQLGLRLARERDVLTQLNHPQIMPVYAFGLQPSYMYLVAAFVKEASLGQFLQQNTRFTPQQMLPILKQLAAGLDYMHSQGVVHGMLSLSNIVMNNEHKVSIASLGLRTMLELHGKARIAEPLSHLTSENGTFLGSPDYISPERVLGMPIDARSDIYALGIMLFEMLSGSRPFNGTSPLEIALQRLQQPAPSVHAICPAVPEAFDLLFRTMLERDPAKRTQHAGDAAIAFERIVTTLDPARLIASPMDQLTANSQITLPPTVNWFDESMAFPDQQEMIPSIGSGVLSSPRPLPGPSSLGGIDPFVWWSSTSGTHQAVAPTPGTFARRTPVRLNNSRSSARRHPAQQDRRKLVTLIATGAVATGVLSIGGISFAHFVQSRKQSPSQLASGAAPGSTTSTGNTPTASAQKTAGSTPTRSTRATPTAQPTQRQPTPRSNPTPTPAPSHTGTVIGHTSQARNSAVAFTNPADGQGSLLIRLANGTFVACERACTHAGVAVNYDSSSQTLVCPAHGATFDPQNGFAPTSPAPSPLSKVSVTVNADGTVTVS